MRTLLALASIILLSSSLLFADEKDVNGMRFTLGMYVESEAPEVSEEKIDGGLFLGFGFWNIDIYTLLSGSHFKDKKSAETSYGDMEYKKNYEEAKMALGLRYYLFRHRFFAPYLGGHIGHSTLSQYDSILAKDVDDNDDESHYYYGPDIGFVILPGYLFNAFINIGYNKYSSTYKAYEIESGSMLGEWSKKNSNSINLDSFTFSGGLSCTLY